MPAQPARRPEKAAQRQLEQGLLTTWPLLRKPLPERSTQRLRALERRASQPTAQRRIAVQQPVDLEQMPAQRIQRIRRRHALLVVHTHLHKTKPPSPLKLTLQQPRVRVTTVRKGQQHTHLAPASPVGVLFIPTWLQPGTRPTAPLQQAIAAMPQAQRGKKDSDCTDQGIPAHVVGHQPAHESAAGDKKHQQLGASQDDDSRQARRREDRGQRRASGAQRPPAAALGLCRRLATARRRRAGPAGTPTTAAKGDDAAHVTWPSSPRSCRQPSGAFPPSPAYGPCPSRSAPAWRGCGRQVAASATGQR